MDELRRRTAPFDPDTPLTPAPDPWDYLPMPAVRSGPPWATAEMIAAEPALAQRIGRRAAADGSVVELARELRAAAEAGGAVVATGCGTSEHAAMGIAAILEDAWRDAGLPAPRPASAQAFELAQDPPSAGLVIGVSHEGGTAATLAAMEAARAAGARVAAVTGSAGSPGAAAADVVVATVEMDRSWCHTVGYVSPLVAASAVGDAVTGREPRPGAAAARLRTGIDAAYAREGDGPLAAEALAAALDARHLLVVASGVDRVTARELVLKIEEAAWIPSAARDLETFLHGHLPGADAGTGLVLLLTERRALEARAARARQALRAAAAVGMRPCAILGGDAAALIPDDLTPGGRIVIPEAPDLPGAVASLLGAAGPLQLVTLELAARRGTRPDQIRRTEAAWLAAADVADAPER